MVGNFSWDASPAPAVLRPPLTTGAEDEPPGKSASSTDSHEPSKSKVLPKGSMKVSHTQPKTDSIKILSSTVHLLKFVFQVGT